MARFPSVGQELLDVPLPEMVTKLAMGIATAQAALDENSVNTAILLAETEVERTPVFNPTPVVSSIAVRTAKRTAKTAKRAAKAPARKRR